MYIEAWLFRNDGFTWTAGGTVNRLWRDGVTILPRSSIKITTAKNNRPVPALEKTNKHRPVPSRRKEKKKPPRSASEIKNNRPVPPRKKKTTAPSRLEKKNKTPRPAMNSKIHRPEGGNWKQIPPPVSFSLFLVAHLYRIVLACLDAFLVSELCLSPLLFLQIKVSVEPFVVGLEFAVANFLIVQVKK